MSYKINYRRKLITIRSYINYDGSKSGISIPRQDWRKLKINKLFNLQKNK